MCRSCGPPTCEIPLATISEFARKPGTKNPFGWRLAPHASNALGHISTAAYLGRAVCVWLESPPGKVAVARPHSLGSVVITNQIDISGLRRRWGAGRRIVEEK